MELKLDQNPVTIAFSVMLLIEPYGIETKIVRLEKRATRLLIEPYGIETRKFSMVYESGHIF